MLRIGRYHCESALVKPAGRYTKNPAPSWSFPRRTPSSREGFRVCRASPLAGNPPCTLPVKAAPKRSYANTATGVLRVAPSNTPFRRGKQRTGGTGAVQHPSSSISVQYSSFAVQQYVAAQQCSPAEAWCTAQQPLQHISAASCTSSPCSSVL